jgi:hypothetical protein
MTLAFVASINTLPIDGFTINGFGVTGFRTFLVAPLDANEISAIASVPTTDDDDCCGAIMVPPAKPPLRTPWGTARWLR